MHALIVKHLNNVVGSMTADLHLANAHAQCRRPLSKATFKTHCGRFCRVSEGCLIRHLPSWKTRVRVRSPSPYLVKARTCMVRRVMPGMSGLTLKNRRFADPKSEERALFVKTKRYVLALLKVQPGQSLFEVLPTTVTAEQEALWARVVEVERQNSRRNKRAGNLPARPDVALDDVYKYVQHWTCWHRL
jgi:hypothetical protein